MKRATQRLDAVARLRERLAREDLAPTDRSLLEAFQRTQMLVRRERDTADGRSAVTHDSVRFLPGFHADVATLEPDDIARVYGTLGRLLDARAKEQPSPHPSGPLQPVEVPGRALSIAVSSDDCSGELLVHGLTRSGAPIGGVGGSDDAAGALG